MKQRLYFFFLLLWSSLIYAQEKQPVSATPPDTMSLREVVVKTDKVLRSGQKDIIRITRSMRKGAYDTKMMLNKAPGFSYHFADKSLSYLGHKNLIVLVDSVEKNINQIMSLHHLRFEKIEVIHHPMGKYAHYDAIINLHTKKDYSGYESLTNANTEFYPTDGNGVGKHFASEEIGTTFAYTKNKWNILIGYAGSFGEGMRPGSSKQMFLQHNYQEVDLAHPAGEKTNGFRWGEHSGGISVDYQINKRHSFSLQYAIENNSRTDYTNKHSLVSDLAMSYADTLYIQKLEKDFGWRQGLGLFYRGKTGAWHYNATFNYITRNWDFDYQMNKSSGYSWINNTHRNMDHTWFQADANRRFLSEKLYWSITYNHFWRKYLQTLPQNEEVLNKNELRNHDLCTYLSYDFNQNLSLYAALGVKPTSVSYFSNKDNYLDIYGKAGIFTRFLKYFWGRIDYSCNMKNPSLDQTTQYGYYADTLIWQEGNPLLRTSLEHSLRCKLNVLGFATLSCDLYHSPRNICYVSELKLKGSGTHIVRAPQNGNHTYALTNLNVNMNNPLFLLEANIGYHYKRAEFGIYKTSANGFSGDVQLGYELHKNNITCMLNYKWGRKHSLSPQTLQSVDTDRLLIGIYKVCCKGNLMMELTYSLPFSFSSQQSKYYTITPFYEKVYEQSQKDVMRNILHFGLSYRIQGGKSIRQYKKEMSQER